MSMSAMPIMGDMGQAIGGSLGGNLPPNVGVGFGMPANGGQNPVADQTQQMANNPIYGQQSPFQPPSNSGQTQQNPNVGIGFGMPADGGKSGFGGIDWFGPKYDPSMGGNQQLFDEYNKQAQQDSYLTFARQAGYQYGGGYQNWLKNQQNTQGGLLNGPQLGGGPAGQPPITNPLQGGPLGGPQLGGGPAGQPPITNQPRQQPQPQPNPQYGGGLRPAPRNYRPPQRGGNLRSFMQR
jgi:hypothetical protein